MPRARRRLSLTRQLMQLLFSAPPEVVLSAEARSNYETVTYVLARRTLGDTCSFMSCSDGENMYVKLLPSCLRPSVIFMHDHVFVFKSNTSLTMSVIISDNYFVDKRTNVNRQIKAMSSALHKSWKTSWVE